MNYKLLFLQRNCKSTTPEPQLKSFLHINFLCAIQNTTGFVTILIAQLNTNESLVIQPFNLLEHSHNIAKSPRLIYSLHGINHIRIKLQCCYLWQVTTQVYWFQSISVRIYTQNNYILWVFTTAVHLLIVFSLTFNVTMAANSPTDDDILVNLLLEMFNCLKLSWTFLMSFSGHCIKWQNALILAVNFHFTNNLRDVKSPQR